MNAAERIELEIKVRKIAIDISTHHGEEGVEFFQEQFPLIAIEYNDAHKLKCNGVVNPPSLIEW